MLARVAARTASVARPAAAAGRRFISVGASMPEVDDGLFLIRDGTSEKVSTTDVFSGRTVIMFGLPGAFTPVCSASHLPGFIAKADEIMAKGVDEIICLSPNDKFVTSSWGKDQGAGSKVSFLADGNLSLTRALDMVEDMTAHGMGMRSNRYSMIVKDGKVTTLLAEKDSGHFEVSDAEATARHL